MPRVTITFDLPEEYHDLEAALRGAEAQSVLWDIDQHCRSLLKHGEPTAEARALAQQIREMIPAEFLDA